MVNVRREYKRLKIEDKRNKGIRFVFLLYFDNEGNVYFYQNNIKLFTRIVMLIFINYLVMFFKGFLVFGIKVQVYEFFGGQENVF